MDVNSKEKLDIGSDINVQKWLMQSQTVARDNIYKNIIENSELPAAYISEKTPILEQQLARTGFRLAQILINMLKNIRPTKSQIINAVTKTVIQPTRETLDQNLGTAVQILDRATNVLFEGNKNFSQNHKD
jgi:hypothetical protein